VFEVFFNHKKRYKGFPWDGDETRFPEDLPYFVEYDRLVKKAVPAGSPVRFRLRTDASWMMEHQFQALAGVVNFWVVSGSIFSFYPQAPALLKARGDIVWSYGGTPEVSQPLAWMALKPLEAWLWGIDGYVRWLTVAPGRDPWFDFEGGETVLAYPGERFGIHGPIPSVRLKVQRNCVQDLALLAALKQPPGEVKAAVAREFNGTKPGDWWTPKPPLASTPPEEWTNADIDDAVPSPKVDPESWDRVRRYLYREVR
jgi:hypothetical protein